MMVIVLNVCGYLDKTKKIVSLEMTNERDAPARVISCSASPTDNSVAMDIIGLRWTAEGRMRRSGHTGNPRSPSVSSFSRPELRRAASVRAMM
jgi:hypothetical protein